MLEEKFLVCLKIQFKISTDYDHSNQSLPRDINYGQSKLITEAGKSTNQLFDT